MASKRSRTGCSTCRGKRQKCDEAKPTCLNCRKRGVVCGGYAIRLKEFVNYDGASGQMVCKTVRGNPVEEQQQQQQQQQQPRRRRKMNRRKESPNSGAEFNSATPDQPCSEENCIMPESSETGISNDLASTPISSIELFGPSMHWVEKSPELTRAEQSLATRGTTVSFDDVAPYDSNENMPSTIDFRTWSNMFSSESSFSLEDKQTPTSTAISDYLIEELVDNEDINILRAPNDTSTYINRAPFMGQQRIDSDSFEQHLFRHFINVLAPSLHPIHAERNPYTVVYATLAIKSPVMRSAVLAAAANHLVALGQLPIWATKPYHYALRKSFRRSLDAADDKYMMAAAVLLSIAVEIIGPGMGSWSLKLGGVRNLLSEATHNAISTRNTILTPSTKFLWLQYSWMEAIGRTLWIPGCSQMPLLSVYSADHDLNHELENEQDRWFANLPDYSVVVLLRKASDCVENVRDASNQENFVSIVQQMMPDVADLIANIKSWKPKPSSAMEPFAQCAPDVAEIWRQGLLCYVYTDICKVPTTSHRIQKCVSEAMPAIKRVNWLQCTLWPVFMVGLHAGTPEHQRTIEESFRTMSSTHYFKTPLSLIDICRRVWSSSDSSTDWRRIVAESGMELNILL